MGVVTVDPQDKVEVLYTVVVMVVVYKVSIMVVVRGSGYSKTTRVIVSISWGERSVKVRTGTVVVREMSVVIVNSEEVVVAGMSHGHQGHHGGGVEVLGVGVGETLTVRVAVMIVWRLSNGTVRTGRVAVVIISLVIVTISLVTV